ncbi:hypothetical protein C8R44DRAFT_736634 [Mycena epipterygia]|nr:hypothetical protein C8R44DRAFT_736634 [Mycena epipterygia]
MPWEDDSNHISLIVLDDVDEEVPLLTVQNIYTDTGLSPQKKAKRRKPVPARTTTSKTNVSKKKKKTNVTATAVPEGFQPEAQAWDPLDMDDFHASSSATMEANETTDPQDHHQFCNAVGIGMIGFFQISKSLFVAEGWDKRRSCTNGLWYHIMVVDGWETIIVCMCSGGRPCVHEQYLEEQRTEAFPATELYKDDLACEAVLFSRNMGENSTTSLFSIATPSHPDLLKARAIVTNIGDGLGLGSWICSRDSGQNECVHISSARRHLQKLLTLDATAQDVRDWSEMGVVEAQVRVAKIVHLVSYLAILAPIWAALPEDPELYARSFMGNNPPTAIPIGANARCSCGAEQLGCETISRPCTIYTVACAVAATVELQICHKCSTGRCRCVGPDARELGLFNYNNSTFFTHDLMDDYTAAFTSSETPFVAWTFLTAWFLYSDLQNLSGDMQCPDCGPYPDDTIWDGVTLAFSRKNLLASLCPPTTVLPEAFHNPSSYVQRQTLLTEADLRKAVRNSVAGTNEADGEDGTYVEESRPEKKEEQLQRVNAIPDVVQRLEETSEHLGSLFDRHFGLSALASKTTGSKLYVELFKQCEVTIETMFYSSIFQHLQDWHTNMGVYQAGKRRVHYRLFPKPKEMYLHSYPRVTRPDIATPNADNQCIEVKTKATSQQGLVSEVSHSNQGLLKH